MTTLSLNTPTWLNRYLIPRLNSDIQGGAWCPREPVSRDKEDQYLEVDLGSTHVIAEVLTQGRFANGQGQEYAQAYRLHYWRQGLVEFKEYRDSVGKTVSPGEGNRVLSHDQLFGISIKLQFLCPLSLIFEIKNFSDLCKLVCSNFFDIFNFILF